MALRKAQLGPETQTQDCGKWKKLISMQIYSLDCPWLEDHIMAPACKRLPVHGTCGEEENCPISDGIDITKSFN